MVEMGAIATSEPNGVALLLQPLPNQSRVIFRVYCYLQNMAVIQVEALPIQDHLKTGKPLVILQRTVVADIKKMPISLIQKMLCYLLGNGEAVDLNG